MYLNKDIFPTKDLKSTPVLKKPTVVTNFKLRFYMNFIIEKLKIQPSLSIFVSNQLPIRQGKYPESCICCLLYAANIDKSVCVVIYFL